MEDTRSRIRRNRSLSPTRELAEEMSPLNGQGGGNKRSGFLAIGRFLVPSMFQIKVRDKKDASAKKKFQVNVPTKMLVILGLVFFFAPLSVFFYKEKHLHENHDHEPHFKQQKFVNVDKEQALAHFVENQNQTSEITSVDEHQTSDKTSRDDPEPTPIDPEESEMINATKAIGTEQNFTMTNGEQKEPPSR